MKPKQGYKFWIIYYREVKKLGKERRNGHVCYQLILSIVLDKIKIFQVRTMFVLFIITSPVPIIEYKKCNK